MYDFSGPRLDNATTITNIFLKNYLHYIQNYCHFNIVNSFLIFNYLSCMSSFGLCWKLFSDMQHNSFSTYHKFIILYC